MSSVSVLLLGMRSLRLDQIYFRTSIRSMRLSFRNYPTKIVYEIILMQNGDCIKM